MQRSKLWRHPRGLFWVLFLSLLLMIMPGVAGVASASSLVQGSGPSIEVAKAATPAQVPEPGGVVTFNIKVRNTSGEDLDVTLVRLEDDLYGNLINVGNPNLLSTTCASTVIRARDTYQCTFTAEVVGSGGSSVTDMVTAKVRDAGGNAAQASARATVSIITGRPAELRVEKNANPAQVTEPGGRVRFGVKVRNSGGGQPLTLVRLEDNLYGDLTSASNPKIFGSSCSLVTIQPGDTYQCAFEAEVVGRGGSTVTDTVTARARDAAGNALQASAQASVDINAGEKLGIVVDKKANPSNLTEPGGSVTYRVRVRNTSGVSLQLVRLEDNLYGNLTSGGNPGIYNNTCALVTILPGDTYQCTFTADVTGSSGTSLTDTVTARARDSGGNAVQDSAQATVTIGAKPKPGLSVSKKASPTWVLEPGEYVTYKVRVANNSPAGVPLDLTQLVDDIYGDLTDLGNPEISNGNCQLVTIQPGESYQCSFKGEVSGSAGTTLTDEVTAVAQDGSGNQVHASAKATVKILSHPPDTGVPLTPPMIAGGLMALGAAATAAGAMVQRRKN